MKKFKSEDLISKLQADARQLIAAVEHMKQTDIVKLGMRPAEGSWSVAQVLEHLNMYDRYYLPQIEKAVGVVSKDWNAWFVAGFWGDYFTRSMLPTNVYEVKNKMKAMKGYRPDRAVNVEAVLDDFIKNQHKTIQLLETARKRNLNTIKIPITISKFVRLKLGDAFRFLMAHKQRHMIQARNALKTLGVSTDKFPVILEAAPR